MFVFFFKDLWIHCYPDGVIVDTKIRRNTTIPLLREQVKKYCYFVYTPKNGDVVVDVGAGIGTETFVFSRDVGSSGKVVSIEAHPKTFLCLKKMCAFNDFKNVVFLNFAVADVESDVFIEDLSSHMDNRLVSTGKKGIRVKALSLDDLLLKKLGVMHIDLLKMNIEGAEKLAIKGMAESIKNVHHVLIACHDFIANQESNQEDMKTKKVVTDFLKENGFTVFVRETEKEGWLRDCVYGVNHLLN